MRPHRLLALWFCGVCACCGDAAETPARLRVFAASSLTEVFEALGEAFEASRPGVRVELHCAGTPQLVFQIREGAQADLFASADLEQMQAVVAAGETLGVPEVFATNRLAVVVPQGNPAEVRELADLARADLRVVLCGPDVPAGRYARRLLRDAGVTVASVSDEPSVKAVVGKLLLGEVDAGVVYATDARAAGDRLESIQCPECAELQVAYPMATLGSGGAREVAAEFRRFMLSERGQQILDGFGFTRP